MLTRNPPSGPFSAIKRTVFLSSPGLVIAPGESGSYFVSGFPEAQSGMVFSYSVTGDPAAGTAAPPVGIVLCETRFNAAFPGFLTITALNATGAPIDINTTVSPVQITGILFVPKEPQPGP